jgi:hypothetical protein
MDVRVLGRTEDGLEIQFSAEALQADGIIVVNRIKPHTDFTGSIGSGLLKMIVVGLGKRTGAAAYHIESSRLGYERVLRTIARASLRLAPILGGLGIVENQRHETARVELLHRDEIESGEERLFAEAKRLMPKPPFATGRLPASIRRATILNCEISEELNAFPPVGEIKVVGKGLVQ